VQYCPTLLTNEQLIDDAFFDFNMMKDYQQEFDLIYRQTFGTFPHLSFKYYCRYERGLSLYHSLLYKRRNKCASYNVCVKADNDHTHSVLYYGQILFFFCIENEPFFFLKRFINSRNKFSSLVKPMEEIPNWTMYIDKYYPIVRRSSPNLVIYPCSFIQSKCIFFPLDEEFSACTPIELETEHD
jgi:hypothetical protein